MILSPDTNIFISAYLGKEETERIKSTLLIENDFKQAKSVLVSSVKHEFYDLVDTFHTTIEAMLLYLNSKKSLDKAISLLPETNFIDKNQLKKGLKLLDLSVQDIDTDLKKRESFATNINKKLSEIKGDFALIARTYFMKDQLPDSQVNQCIEVIEEGCKQINQKYGKVIHHPDNEHWIRTALTNKKEETKFVTTDYFGLKNSNYIQVAKEIEMMINNKLGTLFSFLFK
ncbi:MAG: hypothetical protein JW744_03745 [Candidatus Diapherotrites archaeon]|uniref:Uncharacterized protein n=1 Tax=Candidatus Iainarchaeum sp. TaxID=3101447 RepID=A0A938YRG7_9ARCH|nr:hypothetical protein [Candidatus Diapherotrites archaeon]